MKITEAAIGWNFVTDKSKTEIEVGPYGKPRGHNGDDRDGRSWPSPPLRQQRRQIQHGPLLLGFHLLDRLPAPLDYGRHPWIAHRRVFSDPEIGGLQADAALEIGKPFDGARHRK